MIGSYDEGVADLARVFLTDDDTRHPDDKEHAARVHSLALAMQSAIEEWIEDHPVEVDAQTPDPDADPEPEP